MANVLLLYIFQFSCVHRSLFSAGCQRHKRGISNTIAAPGLQQSKNAQGNPLEGVDTSHSMRNDNNGHSFKRIITLNCKRWAVIFQHLRKEPVKRLQGTSESRAWETSFESDLGLLIPQGKWARSRKSSWSPTKPWLIFTNALKSTRRPWIFIALKQTDF